MSDKPPLFKSKEEFSSIIKTIKSDQSTVGIDAQYTHAIIIDYLERITQRLKALEETVSQQNQS